jgi:hypothetical protein
MNILVMLEESPVSSSVLAHVDSVPAVQESERRSRDVVTLYGAPTVRALSLAIAALLDSMRSPPGGESLAPGTVRHLGIWEERGATGEAAWRDAATGRLVSRDLTIPIERLQITATELLGAHETDIRRLVAGLQMPDWPEGTRRAISFSLTAPALAGVGADEGLLGAGGSGGDAGDAAGGRPDLLETYRSSAGLTYDNEGD